MQTTRHNRTNLDDTMTRQPWSSEMEVTDPEPTADLDSTSELEPAAELEPAVADGEQSVLLDIDAAVSEAASQVAMGQVELGVVVVEGDKAWDHEKRKVAQFVAHGCSCNLGPKGTPCHKLFSAVQCQELRDECRELTKEELDLVVMGELQALTLHTGKTKRVSDRVRSLSTFQLGGHRICLKTFASCTTSVDESSMR